VFLFLEIAKENARDFIQSLEIYQNNHEEMTSFYIDSLEWILKTIEIKELSIHVCMVLLSVYFIYGVYSKYKYLVRKKMFLIRQLLYF